MQDKNLRGTHGNYDYKKFTVSSHEIYTITWNPKLQAPKTSAGLGCTYVGYKVLLLLLIWFVFKWSKLTTFKNWDIWMSGNILPHFLAEIPDTPERWRPLAVGSSSLVYHKLTPTPLFIWLYLPGISFFEPYAKIKSGGETTQHC